MAYNSAIDNVYNHYLTTYAPNSSVSKYDTHKKSELRGIYNSMLKLNKDAPLYLLNSAQDSREFAVNLKENARALRNTIASIGGQTDESLFKQKSAYSTDEGMVSAEFIGETADEKSIPSFSIEVTALASPQVNLGYALSSNSKVSLPTDTYLPAACDHMKAPSVLKSAKKLSKVFCTRYHIRSLQMNTSFC